MKRCMFTDDLRKKAAQQQRVIVFPESTDPRVLKAADALFHQKLVFPLLIGPQPEIAQAAQACGANIEGIQIRDPLHDAEFQNFVNLLVQLRQQKGMTPEQAAELMKDPVYFGTMMVKTGKAHGLVSGAAHSTSDTLRPALQIIKTRPDVSLASSFFFMVLPDGRVLLFADCGVNINPTAEQLAEIGFSTVQSTKEFGLDPRVAMLSFSTKGSAKHKLSDKVVQATAMLQQKNPGCPVDGELQVDAALVPEIAQSKANGSPVQGNATILIFPDLNAGNIGYKLVQRLAGAQALGPIMQGLAMPVNDLSRGCSEEDIITVACITALQTRAQQPGAQQPSPSQNQQNTQAAPAQPAQNQVQQGNPPQQNQQAQPQQPQAQPPQQPQQQQQSQEQGQPSVQYHDAKKGNHLSPSAVNPQEMLSDIKKLAEDSSHAEKAEDSGKTEGSSSSPSSSGPSSGPENNGGENKNQ